MNVIAAFILAQRNWQGKHCRRSRLRIQNKKRLTVSRESLNIALLDYTDAARQIEQSLSTN
jgi:hypothetical protein